MIGALYFARRGARACFLRIIITLRGNSYSHQVYNSQTVETVDSPRKSRVLPVRPGKLYISGFSKFSLSSDVRALSKPGEPASPPGCVFAKDVYARYRAYS